MDKRALPIQFLGMQKFIWKIQSGVGHGEVWFQLTMSGDLVVKWEADSAWTITHKISKNEIAKARRNPISIASCHVEEMRETYMAGRRSEQR